MADNTIEEHNVNKAEYTYDAATIAELKQLSDDAFSGTTPMLTWEQVLINVNARRKNNKKHL